jgi:RsiW-degrading membrane proteinase PrsW (M82 family)
MKINLWAGYLQAVILHGFYDTCAVMENETMTIIFFAFVVLMDIAVIRMIKKDSREDRPI